MAVERGNGVYVAHSGPLRPAQQLWVAVLGCGSDAVLAGLTAAREGGLQRGRRAGDPRARAGQRHGPTSRAAPYVLPRRDDADASWRTGPRAGRTRMCSTSHARPARMPRSLVDAAQWATSDDEARAVVAAGCQQRLVTAGGGARGSGPDAAGATAWRSLLETVGFAAAWRRGRV